MKLFFAVLLSTPLFIESQEVDAGDILFLKVQELEGEISALRSELESQAYLIDKLLNENQSKVEINNTVDTQAQVAENSFRFEGINDGQSIDEVYEQAISQLNNKNFEDAKKSFVYLADNFSDDEKIPLSLFWLGEISYIKEEYQLSNQYFLELITLYPEHYRIPLAHKKIGDILMMSGELGAAKIKYQFVVQTYPNNAASSLALQLLENME